MAAADVGHAPARFEPGLHPVEGGDPFADEVHGVAGTEEALASLVHVVHVVVPADAVAGLDRLGDARRVEHRADRDLEEAGQVGGAVLVGERDRLLRRQRVATRGGVVLDVPTGRLIA